MRESNGQQEFGTIDLTTKEFLDSPYYYLQQNDIVYVEPRKQKATYTNIERTRTWISFATLLLTTGTLIYTISKK